MALPTCGYASALFRQTGRLGSIGPARYAPGAGDYTQAGCTTAPLVKWLLAVFLGSRALENWPHASKPALSETIQFPADRRRSPWPSLTRSWRFSATTRSVGPKTAIWETDSPALPPYRAARNRGRPTGAPRFRRFPRARRRPRCFRAETAFVAALERHAAGATTAAGPVPGKLPAPSGAAVSECPATERSRAGQLPIREFLGV
jgi:hypothetical protein